MKFTWDVPLDHEYANMTLEHVSVNIDANCADRGSLQLTLTSPHGTVSHLQERHGDRNRDIRWTYLTVANWGETPGGKWVRLNAMMLV